MGKYLARDPWLLTASLVAAILALLLDAFAYYLGLSLGTSTAPGFLSGPKLGWALFPLFFLVLAVLGTSAWNLYQDAWDSLPENKVLYKGESQVHGSGLLAPHVKWMSKIRVHIAWLSILLGLLLTSLDAGCLWAEYLSPASDSVCTVPDFSVAYRLTTAFPGVAKTANGFFVLCAYLLQGALIALAWLTLLQISLHGLCFAIFERLTYPRSEALSLQLNTRDPLNEFGLSEINRAINTVFILLALGMVLPVLSARGQPPGAASLGQLLLRGLLPLLLLVPLIIPIVDRYFRIRDASQRVVQNHDPAEQEAFAKQKLWPFEQTQISYLGKFMAFVAFAEYVYVLRGGDIIELVKRIFGGG